MHTLRGLGLVNNSCHTSAKYKKKPTRTCQSYSHLKPLRAQLAPSLTIPQKAVERHRAAMTRAQSTTHHKRGFLEGSNLCRLTMCHGTIDTQQAANTVRVLVAACLYPCVHITLFCACQLIHTTRGRVVQQPCDVIQ